MWNTTAGLGFGASTSYGKHEGTDINFNSGGNSDLGQPLFAVDDGEITSVHNHTGSPTFGKHIHLKFNIDGKDYFAHYAHCNEIFVVEGQKVKQGDKIGTVGNSGTTFAHLHFGIKNQPTGIDGIAKTSEDLKKWENPIPFIERNFEEESKADITEAELTQIREDRDKNWRLYEEQKKINEKLTEDLQKKTEEAETYLKQLEKLNEEDTVAVEQLLLAQQALEPYQSTISSLKTILGAKEEATLDDIKTLVQLLKDSKVKYLQPKGIKIGPFTIYYG